MNWALVAACVLALPLVCMFPEKYRRTDIDVKMSGNADVNVSIDVNDKTACHSVEGRNNQQCTPDQSDIRYSPYTL